MSPARMVEGLFTLRALYAPVCKRILEELYALIDVPFRTSDPVAFTPRLEENAGLLLTAYVYMLLKVLVIGAG